MREKKKKKRTIKKTGRESISWSSNPVEQRCDTERVPGQLTIAQSIYSSSHHFLPRSRYVRPTRKSALLHCCEEKKRHQPRTNLCWIRSCMAKRFTESFLTSKGKGWTKEKKRKQRRIRKKKKSCTGHGGRSLSLADQVGTFSRFINITYSTRTTTRTVSV